MEGLHMAKMEFGLIVDIAGDLNKSFRTVADFGIPTCQLNGTGEALMRGEYPDPQEVRAAAEAAGVRVSSVFLVWEGQQYNNTDGPATMGLVPPSVRAERMKSGKALSDWTKRIGVNSITCHIGFIPDDENDPIYPGFIDTMRDFGEYCAKNEQIFCFETGQELASTLMRTILDIDTGNMFVNLDPANLILYGKSNPLDAIEIFGEYVRGFHAKDGLWPNRDESLGLETALGEGAVRFDLLIPRLKAKGFTGPVTIEREISGPQQRKDILKAMKLLEPML